MMATTLKDIAKLTGLSVPTVCLILNGQEHKFRAESRKAVFEAAKQLKYRPDMVMRRMGRASGRRDAIGFLTPSDSSNGGAEHFADHSAHEYLCGVNDYLLAHDQLFVVAKLGQNNLGGNSIPRMLSERFVDGLLLVESGLPAELSQLIEHYEITTVWLNTERRAETDCVFPDEIHGGKMATEHFLKLGHERVVYISAPWGTPLGGISRTYAVEERGQGYREAMAAARLRPEVIEATFAKPHELENFLASVAASHKTDSPITGILTGSFPLAVKVVEMLSHTSLRCPQDASVISTGDLHLFSNVWPEIVRLNCDRAKIGVAAAEMILNKVNDNGMPQKSQAFKGTLSEGATVQARGK